MKYFHSGVFLDECPRCGKTNVHNTDAKFSLGKTRIVSCVCRECLEMWRVYVKDVEFEEDERPNLEIVP